MTENKLDKVTYQAPHTPSLEQNGNDSTSIMPIPGVEFLGRGYNIIRFDPLNPGDPNGISQINLFQLDIDSTTQDGKYLIPKGSIYTPDPRLSFQAQSTQLETGFDLNQKFSASVKASGGYGPLSFSASGSYEEFSQMTQSTASIVTFTSFDVQVWVVSWQKQMLSQAFKEAVSQLPITYDQSAYFKFIETFGTHYPQQIVYGGMGYQSYTFTREDRAVLDGEKVDINVAAEVGLALSASVGGETSRERQEFQRLSSVSSATSLLYVGGIADNPIPVQITLEELTELLTEENFPNIAISSIRNNLTQANEAYALENASGYVRYADSSEDQENTYSIIGTQSNEPFLSYAPGSRGVYLVNSQRVSQMVSPWHILGKEKTAGDILRTGDVVNITLDQSKTFAFTFMGADLLSDSPVYQASGFYSNSNDPNYRTRFWQILDPLAPNNRGEIVYVGKEYVLYNEALGKTLGFYSVNPSSQLATPPVADTVTDVRARCKFI